VHSQVVCRSERWCVRPGCPPLQIRLAPMLLSSATVQLRCCRGGVPQQAAVRDSARRMSRETGDREADAISASTARRRLRRRHDRITEGGGSLDGGKCHRCRPIAATRCRTRSSDRSVRHDARRRLRSHAEPARIMLECGVSGVVTGPARQIRSRQVAKNRVNVAVFHETSNNGVAEIASRVGGATNTLSPAWERGASARSVGTACRAPLVARYVTTSVMRYPSACQCPEHRSVRSKSSPKRVREPVQCSTRLCHVPNKRVSQTYRQAQRLSSTYVDTPAFGVGFVAPRRTPRRMRSRCRRS